MTEERKRKSGFKQFFQFSIIGGSNAAIDIGVLNLLLILFPTTDTITLILFNTTAYTLSVLNSYLWNSTITFSRTSSGNNRQRLGFLVQAAISLVINNLVFIALNALIGLFGVPGWLAYNIAKGSAMASSSIASFFMVKYYVFKDYQISLRKRQKATKMR
ncbi:putative flippase GtrA [Alkalibacillus flavidus]|uniref:Flippase GtrA n=1 Tax=Alkalibacillus flavidus TaxID=546021 RepID=A0ABV2KWR8_9BACI